jgi:hypothetical protein
MSRRAHLQEASVVPIEIDSLGNGVKYIDPKYCILYVFSGAFVRGAPGPADGCRSCELTVSLVLPHPEYLMSESVITFLLARC